MFDGSPGRLKSPSPVATGTDRCRCSWKRPPPVLVEALTTGGG